MSKTIYNSSNEMFSYSNEDEEFKFSALRENEIKAELNKYVKSFIELESITQLDNQDVSHKLDIEYK
jgi:hypothetical protein